MVRQRWVPKAGSTTQVSCKDCAVVKADRSEQLLGWLCGTWRDQKGSTYALSIDVDGTVSVETTRPSGEVIVTLGLIRAESADGGRVVWGKVGARFRYVLDKINDQELCWKSSFAAPFHWERKEKDEDEPEAELETCAEQSVRGRKSRCDLGERRAKLRREFKEQRQEQRQQADADAVWRVLSAGNDGPGEVESKDWEKTDSRGGRARRVHRVGGGVGAIERQDGGWPDAGSRRKHDERAYAQVESSDDKSSTLKQLLGLNDKGQRPQKAGESPRSREASELLQLLRGSGAAHAMARPMPVSPPATSHSAEGAYGNAVEQEAQLLSAQLSARQSPAVSSLQTAPAPYRLVPQVAWAHQAPLWGSAEQQSRPGHLEYDAHLTNLMMPYQQYDATLAPTQPVWGNIESMMPTN